MTRRDDFCNARVLSMLTAVKQRAKQGDRDLRTGYRVEAKAAYAGAHKQLRVAIGTIRGCTLQGRVRAPKMILRALAEAADEFERFEQHLEG